MGLQVSRKVVELGACVVVRMRMLYGEGGLLTVPLYQIWAGSAMLDFGLRRIRGSGGNLQFGRVQCGVRLKLNISTFTSRYASWA